MDSGDENQTQRKKSVIYVGNLDVERTKDALKDFVTGRANSVEVISPKIYNCKTFRSEFAEGEITNRTFGARITVDSTSQKTLCQRNFWPGRIYARPWVFTEDATKDEPSCGPTVLKI